MKLKYILLSICSCFLLATSCGLDYDPIDTYSDVTEGEVNKQIRGFKDKASVDGHLELLYKRMRDSQEHWYVDRLLIGDCRSDNGYAGTTGAQVTPFETNTIDGTNPILYRDWNMFLLDIGRANTMVVFVDSVQDKSLSASEILSYKAQGQIFRAMILFDMTRLWGDIPLITYVADDITEENIEEIYPQYFPKRSSQLEVYQQIEKDLLAAVQYAPSNDAGNKTKFSKSVAKALLAKMYAEKPLRDYDKVIQYANEVEADGFALVTDFSDIFGMNATVTDAKMRNTKESILEAQFTPGSGNWCTWMFGKDLVNGESNFDWAKWVTPSRDLIKAYEDEGDKKRFAETVVYYKAKWSNYYPSDHYPFMYKLRSAHSSIIKYRYADILLLKAEAMIMKKGTDLAGAANIIDQVRQRAGLSKLSNATKGSKDAMVDALLKERRLELAFEGERWYDLVRLDKVELVMNAIHAKDSGRKARVYPYDANSYLMPIPQNAIDQNPKLEQNTGY